MWRCYVFSKSEEYRRDARRAHIQAESARMPQEKEVLLEIERAFERLVAMEEWLEGSQKKGVEPCFRRERARIISSVRSVGRLTAARAVSNAMPMRRAVSGSKFWPLKKGLVKRRETKKRIKS